MTMTFEEWKNTLNIDITDSNAMEILRTHHNLNTTDTDKILEYVYNNQYLSFFKTKEDNNMT